MGNGFHLRHGIPSRFYDVLSSETLICFLLFSLLFFSGSGFSQTLIVKWDFPNNPDDSVADGGITPNLGKYIGTRGGAGTSSFGFPGFTTRCGGAQHWSNGANIKCWQVEFTTLSSSQLTIRSKNKSFHPQDFGPRDWLVQYRIGSGGSWTTFANFQIRTGNQWDSLATTPLPAACNNQASVSIRWLMASNIPTQGNGTVTDDAFNFIDDVVIYSGCNVPTILAVPESQSICPGASITPINITNPNNIQGTSFSWTRDNTGILTGIGASGTANPITGSLNSTMPGSMVTTTFTITANSGGCTSVTTATVTAGDISPPVFLVNPGAVHFCVQDIIKAFWNFAGDITPSRPDWYTFHSGQTTFDLNPATFSDNCTTPANLILHWKISLSGGGILSSTGQISHYPSDIVFPLGTSIITYWLEDIAGNLTPEALKPAVQVIVHPRPDITRNF